MLYEFRIPLTYEIKHGSEIRVLRVRLNYIEADHDTLSCAPVTSTRYLILHTYIILRTGEIVIAWI